MVKSIQEAGGKAAAVKADVSKLDEVTSLFNDAAAAFPDEKIEVGVSPWDGGALLFLTSALFLVCSAGGHIQGWDGSTIGILMSA